MVSVHILIGQLCAFTSKTERKNLLRLHVLMLSSKIYFLLPIACDHLALTCMCAHYETIGINTELVPLLVF